MAANWVGASGAADLSGVAANYLKAQASTQFGTRQLSVLKVAQANVFSTYADANSLFSKTVRAIQQTAEIWSVFTPVDGSGSGDYFHVIISTDSQWDGVGAPQTSQGGTAGDASYTAFEASIQAGSGVAATVTIPTGFVAPFHG
jgi:hypothetical protein